MDSLPPWSVVQSMLLAVVLPGLVLGAGLLAGVCAVTRSDTGRLIGGALALAGGLTAGNLASNLLPWWSLETGWPSLFPATLAAVGGGVVAVLASSGLATHHGAPSIARPDAVPAPVPSDARRSVPPTRRSHWGLALRLITAAGGAWWLTPASPLLSRLGWFALLFVGSSLNWEAFRRHGSRSIGCGALLALALPWGGAAAAVLIHAHSARFCDLAVLQTATLAGLGLIAFQRRLEVAALFAGPAIFFPALMLAGAANTFSEVPTASFILVAVAPCALWSLRLPLTRRWSGRVLAAAALVAMLIPCAVAVALAMRAESLDFGG